MTEFEELQGICQRRVDAHQNRDAMFAAMKKMVFMQWDERPDADHIKPTLSPDAYNTVMGIARLLISTDPRIVIIPDSEDSSDEQRADHLEKCLKNLWKRINKKRRWPVHYDATLSAAMFSESAIQISRTQDVVDLLKERNSPKADFMQRCADQVPYSMEVLDPTTIYPEFGAFGLRSILRRFNRPIWQIYEFWGDLAKTAGLDVEGNQNRMIEYNEYWDEAQRVVWFRGAKAPILSDEHGLPFIPFVSTIATGSGMFAAPEEQRLPVLYPLWRGNWWHRQNLAYTMMYTMMTVLANGSWVSKTEDGQGKDVDLSQPLQQIALKLGESIEPLGLQLMPTEILTAMEVAQAKMQESTLPRVVFGDSPSKTMSYSSLNLLAQGGRLPLVPIQRQVGMALAEGFEIILRWIEHKGDSLNLWSPNKQPDLSTADINKDHLEIDVTLTADIPQDKLQLANVVTMLMGAKASDGMPFASRKFASEILGNDQPDDEIGQIVYEKLRGLYVQREITRVMAEMQAEMGQSGAPVEQSGAKPVSGTGFDPSRGGIPPIQAQGLQDFANETQMDRQELPENALYGPRTVE